MLAYPQIDPVLLSIGPLDIRWYSLAYITGILLGAYYINRLIAKDTTFKGLNPFDDMIFYGILGIIIGGRLGYTLFYQPMFYLTHPLEILKLWQGGMSFHGGLLGMIGAMYLFAKKNRYPFLGIMDLCSAAAPIGLFFGRIANFINAELWGRVSDVPWAMVFPGAGPLPRHPSQLYEALLEGLISFIILYLLASKAKIRNQHGIIAGSFLICYGLSRFVVEFFREPDAHLGFFFEYVTMGQMLSLPMILGGIYLIFYVHKTNIKGD
tara:strand:+ start:573 stop:1370 length:798 start_codon:yes stop_codon:yes gene_type:complete